MIKSGRSSAVARTSECKTPIWPSRETTNSLRQYSLLIASFNFFWKVRSDNSRVSTFETCSYYICNCGESLCYAIIADRNYTQELIILTLRHLYLKFLIRSPEYLPKINHFRKLQKHIVQVIGCGKDHHRRDEIVIQPIPFSWGWYSRTARCLQTYTFDY